MGVETVKIINNITNKLGHDLRERMTPKSKIFRAAACFSVYAYEELKAELKRVEELCFNFTLPTFLSEPVAEEEKEFAP